MLVVCGFALIVLTIGEHDLLDAIILWVEARAGCR
jgi:hypothetical protein